MSVDPPGQVYADYVHGTDEIVTSGPGSRAREALWSLRTLRGGSGVRCPNRAGRSRLARHESESPTHPVVAKEALAAAEHNGIDHQPNLVDELVLEKGSGELSAANHKQIVARLAFMNAVVLDWLAETLNATRANDRRQREGAEAERAFR